MAQPIVHGPAFSTYVRSVRLTLAEKGVEHTLEELDFLAGAHKKEPHVTRHPWGKVPAFEHNGETLYESEAIMRYVDEVFDGPSLPPSTPLDRARMTQIMSVVDSYGYTPCVGHIFLQRVFAPMVGNTPDEDMIRGAVEPAGKFVAILEGFLGDGDYFLGEVTLADLHVLPVVTYLAAAPEGQAVLEKAPKLRAWIGRMNGRDSVKQMMPAAS